MEVSSETGFWPSDPEAAFMRIGREDGSRGILNITDNAVVYVGPGLTQNTGRLRTGIQVARNAGSQGTINVTSGGALYRAPRTSGTGSIPVRTFSNPRSFAVDDDYLYVTDRGSQQLTRIPR